MRSNYMTPGSRRKVGKGQLGLFGNQRKEKTTPEKKLVRKRLSPETVACRELAAKLKKRGLICATLTDRIREKRLNAINVAGKAIETLVKTPGFNVIKFVDELSEKHVQNSETMRKFISECWPYKKTEDEIKAVNAAINIISILVLESKTAVGGRRNFVDVQEKQRERKFERKISED